MSLKIYILLFSYNRPRMIKEAIKSVYDQSYDSYELFIIDDASTVFDPRSLELNDKTILHCIDDTKEAKLERKGSWIGKVVNEYILSRGEPGVCVFLCDDDMLFPGYLSGLSMYYMDPEPMYSYAHIVPFHDGEPLPERRPSYHWLNKSGSIDPFCQVDASQVTWRTECFTEGGVRFPFPKTSCLDSDLFGQLAQTYGLCPGNGLISQYKRQHENQLGIHQSLDRVD